MVCRSKRPQDIPQAEQHNRHAGDKAAAYFQFFLLVHTLTLFHSPPVIS